MKISIIGTGIYSLALAHILDDKGYDLYLWTENKNVEKEFKKTKKVESICSNEFKNVNISNDMGKVLENTSLIIIAISSKYVKGVTDNIEPLYKKNTPVLIASKGFDEKNMDLLSNTIANTLKTKNISVISGPTFANDLLNDEIAALALASNNRKSSKLIKNIFESEKIKIRPNKDIIGLQVCGAVKNIVAIASGILDGLGYSNSTQAFLITESIHDIKDIIYSLGGISNTVLSFAGIGDLILTCTSTKSRNYTYGKLLGSSKTKAEKYLEKTTVEGYNSLETLYLLLKSRNIKNELINKLYDIIFQNHNPNELQNFLITKK